MTSEEKNQTRSAISRRMTAIVAAQGTKSMMTVRKASAEAWPMTVGRIFRSPWSPDAVKDAERGHGVFLGHEAGQERRHHLPVEAEGPSERFDEVSDPRQDARFRLAVGEVGQQARPGWT